jgi:DNA polymerase elongation subunit (family B)
MNRLSPVQRIYNRTVHDAFGKDRLRWYIEGISLIDYLELYKRFCLDKRESYKLDRIGEIEIGENKIDYGTQNLSSLATNDWNTFVDYNIQDVNILKKLDHKLQFINLLRMVAYMGLTTFEGALGTIGPITGAIAIRARHKNLVIPTFTRESSSGKNPGAFVAEPKQGFQESIVSFDANSLYPNLMISLNMSPETKVGNIIDSNGTEVTIKHVNGQQFVLSNEKFTNFIKSEQIAVSKAKVLFSQKNKGVVSEMVDHYFKSRVVIQQELEKYEKAIAIIDKKLKKNADVELEKKKKELDIKKEQLNTKQQCIKIFINATYGTFGNKHAPMGDDDIASSITLTGQEVIKEGREIVKRFISENSGVTDAAKLDDCLTGSDTDSIYINISEILKAKNVKFAVDGIITPETYEIVNQLDKRLNSDIKVFVEDTFNSIDSRIKFKREMLADSALFLQKKRYVAHILDNKGIPCNKFKYTGVDVVRTNMPKIIKPHVKKIIETMLLTRDYYKTTQIFNETYELFRTLSINEIAFTKGISDYDKYAVQCTDFNTAKGMPNHVKAAYYYNLLLKRYNLESKYEKINSGDKIRHFYVYQPNKLGLKEVGFKYNFPEELKDVVNIDYKKMFDKIVFAAIEKFYTSVNWSIKDPGTNPQTDLFDLLS